MATINPLLQQIDAIAKEKGVDPEIIIGAVQDALEAAARKKYKGEELRARFNPETGDFDLLTVKKIVEEVTDPLTQFSLAEAQAMYGDEAEVDMEVEFPRDKGDLGRIAAQTAKQVIFQKVREAERENVYGEYSQRVGEVERPRQALRERRHHRRAGADQGGPAAAQGAVARRELFGRRPRARRHPRREPGASRGRRSSCRAPTRRCSSSSSSRRSRRSTTAPS
jgi:hypothetical protein